MLRTQTKTFCPSARTPSTTSSEIAVACQIKANSHNRAVEDQPRDVFRRQIARVPRVPVALELAPGPAYRVLRYRATEQRGKRPTHPARVRASQIATSDHRIDLLRAALIRRQRLAVPFAHLAVGGLKPRAGNRDRRCAKRPHHLAIAMAVAVPSDRQLIRCIRSVATRSLHRARQALARVRAYRAR